MNFSSSALLESNKTSLATVTTSITLLFGDCLATSVMSIKRFSKEKFKVFFVSIDPERDTPKIIKDYLGSFENKIYGITGDPKKIFVLSQSWGVLSEKIFTEDGNYLINHSSSVMLLENGKYLDRINHHASYKDMLKAINKYLR